MPKVSILTAAYNAATTIAATAASVLAQTYDNWEWVITSDDGRDYAQVLHALGVNDPRIRFTSTGNTKSGECVARNAALAHARGDIMAVLDSDDAFVPEKLERLLPQVIQHGAATSDIVLVESATGKQFPSLARKYPAGLISAEHYITANLHTYSLLMWDRRRADIRWDETIELMPDLMHGLCLFNTVPGIYYDPMPLHIYHKHAASITNAPDAAQRFMASFRVLLDRVHGDTLAVRDTGALSALARFLPRMIALEEDFIREPDADPAMGFYHFIARNRDAFYYW